MVDRISKPTPPITAPSIKKVSKSKPATNEAKTEQSPPDTLTNRVMSKVQKDDVHSEAKLRRQMIYHTLSDILGEKAAGEPKFMALVDRLDSTLTSSHITSEQLREILQKNVK